VPQPFGVLTPPKTFSLVGYLQPASTLAHVGDVPAGSIVGRRWGHLEPLSRPSDSFAQGDQFAQIGPELKLSIIQLRLVLLRSLQELVDECNVLCQLLASDD
jgi:hypothetical protein